MKHSKTLQETKVWKIYIEKVTEKDKYNARIGWIEELFEATKNFLLLVRNSFPNYTMHDERHVLNVIDIMGGLLGKEIVRLTCDEIELLILVACFHDIGMVYDDTDKKKCFSNANKFNHFLQKYYPEYFGTEFSELSDNIKQDYLRMLHPFRIAEVLSKNIWRPYFSEAWQRIILDRVIKVGQAHGEDWNVTAITTKLQCQETDKTDLLFCAMLLRLADILDFDDTRSPRILYSYITNKISISEWQKHLDSLGFIYPETPSTNYLNYEAVCHDPNTEHSLRRYLDWVNNELLICISLQRNCGKEWQRQFPFPRSINRKNIISDGYESGDFCLTMDQKHILELLTGENLYDSLSVFIRELLQNAVDATLLRSEMDSTFDTESEEARIDIWEWYDEEGKLWFRIDDRGTGMTQGMIQRYFLKIGNSYYNSKELRQDLLEHRNNKLYKGISSFGIGFLSCFLSGISAEVSTLYFNENKCKRELESTTDSFINGYAINLSVTGLTGYYIIKNQVMGHIVEKSLPHPDSYLFDELETNNYRSKAGTSIAIQLDTGKLGNVDLKKETVGYLCATRMPIYYNGKRIGLTYREFMEQVHAVSGKTTYELSHDEKEKFDDAFPLIKGNYPTLEVYVTPLDTKKYAALSNLSGALVATKLCGINPTKNYWKVRDEIYVLDSYNHTFSTDVKFKLRVNNSRGRVKKTWASLIKRYGVQTMNALQEFFIKQPKCPASPNIIGEIWKPLRNESLINVWQIWVDSQQKSECEISFAIPSIIQLFGGNLREETFRWVYHGIKTAESVIRQGRPKNGTIFLLEGDWKPKVDIGRSVLRELPIDTMLAIETIIYDDKIRLPYQKKAEKSSIYNLQKWKNISLSEWRKTRKTEIGQWLHNIEYDYIEEAKVELNLPLNTYRQGMTISGKDTQAGIGMNKYWQAYLQDVYIMKINYQNGQTIKFIKKETENVIDYSDFDVFPPMMFCFAENPEDKQYLCCNSSLYRRAITIEHWYAQWLIANGVKLKKLYLRQFEQIINLLWNATANKIILKINEIRKHLMQINMCNKESEKLNFDGWHELSESDFWDSNNWLESKFS